MLKSILGTSCDVDRLVPWLRRGLMRVPLFFPVIVGLKCAQASRVSVYLSAFSFLSIVFIDFFASLLFCFLDEAGVFVGSSCFSFLFSVFTMSIFYIFFLPSPFSSSAFITSSFLLRICVYIFLFR